MRTIPSVLGNAESDAENYKEVHDYHTSAWKGLHYYTHSDSTKIDDDDQNDYAKNQTDPNLDYLFRTNQEISNRDDWKADQRLQKAYEYSDYLNVKEYDERYHDCVQKSHYNPNSTWRVQNRDHHRWNDRNVLNYSDRKKFDLDTDCKSWKIRRIWTTAIR